MLSRSGPPITGRGLAGPRETRRLQKELNIVAAALAVAAEAHASSLGPRFHYETREPFLSWHFNAFLQQHEVLTVQFEAARSEQPDAPPGAAVSTFSVPYELIVTFPPLCSGCLEPTARTLESHGNIRSSTHLSSTETRERTLRVPFAVPLCERCTSYGLDGLMSVSGHTITAPVRERDTGHWVQFRFPNVAYCERFLEANGLPGDRIAPGKYDAHRATQRGRDSAELEAQLASWHAVRDGLGFHRYAHLKYRISRLGGDPREVFDQLTSLAQEFSVTVEHLRWVEHIAQESLPALRVLDPSSS